MLNFVTVKRRFPEARAIPGKNGTEFVVHCPFPHKKGGRYKLNINAESGVFLCQDCGQTGNSNNVWFDEVADAFEDLRIERDEELATILSARSASREGTFARRGGDVWENNVPSPGRLVPFASLSDSHPAVEYLSARGFDIDELRNLEPSMALHYCVKGIPFKTGTTTGRIVFPFYMEGSLKGWQARKVEQVVSEDKKLVWNEESWATVSRNRNGDWTDKSVSKYLTCPGMSRSSVLYGYDQAYNENPSDNQVIVIVEGPLDQLKVGYPSVGTLGNFSDRQLRLIHTYWNTAIIIRDPDIDPESQKFKNILSSLSSIQTCHLSLPNGKDPGETPRHVIWEEIAKEMNKRNYELPLHCQRN
jgi:hypothetical protein